MPPTEAPQTPTPPAKTSKRSRTTLLLAAVVVVGMAIGGGAGAFMAGPLLAGGGAGKAAPSGAGEPEAAAEQEHGEDEAKREAPEGGEQAATVVHVVENLVLNPAHSGGSRFLLLSIGFAVKDEVAAKTLQERDPELRDAIIRFFGARTVDELVDVAQRDSLKVQLRAAVGQRFGATTVRDVYFPQFVIQ